VSTTYNDWLNQLLTTCVVSQSDPNYSTTWQLMLPNFIDYAEQRIYRKLDLRDTRISSYLGLVLAGNQLMVLPTDNGTFVVVDQINVVTPVGATAFSVNRVFNTLQPTTMDFINTCYPVLTTTGVPRYWAYYTASNAFAPLAAGNPAAVCMAPTPDNTYAAIVSGTGRPTPLSFTNQTTILTSQFPDLFFAATMIPASAYMRDFGQQADNPAMSTSWEGMYTALEGAAMVEEFRKKLQSAAWTSFLPAPATPPRV